MKKTNKIFAIFIAISLVSYITLLVKGPSLPKPEQILDEMVNLEPLQTELSETGSFDLNYKNVDYKIFPRYEYEIYGVVVEQYDSENWLDVTHKRDPANSKDLCIVWGENLKNGSYLDFEYKHGEFTCFIKWKSGAGENFDMAGLSNNHLVPANKEIYNKVKKAKIGDQVRISGKLVDYEFDYEGGKYIRNTSVVREDRGCEVIYVEEFQIVKSGNDLYFAAKKVSFYMSLFLISAFLIYKLFL
jgi:hypothetical protein